MNGITIERALAELGLFYGATKEDIRQSYHKLAALYHPDVNPDALATEQYLRIRDAYEFLRKYYGDGDVAYVAGGDYGSAGDGYVTKGNSGVYVHGGGGDTSAGASCGGSRIIGDHSDLSAAATRRAFKEEHFKQEKRLKKREETRKKEAKEKAEEEKRQKIYNDAMMRIHAYRAGEVMANLLEELIKNGNIGG